MYHSFYQAAWNIFVKLELSLRIFMYIQNLFRSKTLFWQAWLSNSLGESNNEVRTFSKFDRILHEDRNYIIRFGIHQAIQRICPWFSRYWDNKNMMLPWLIPKSSTECLLRVCYRSRLITRISNGLSWQSIKEQLLFNAETKNK